MSPYDAMCRQFVILCVALAFLGCVVPATAVYILWTVAVFSLFLLTGGLVWAVVLGARVAGWLARLVR